MARCRRYIAQPYWNRAGGIVAGEPYTFLSATDAEEGGAILSRQAVGVLVFQQWVDVEALIFEEPAIIAVYGQVPRDAMTIDADGPEPWLSDVA
jgi:hypothetical protein